MIKGIVAVDNAWAIGKNNGLLFHLSADLKWFKSHTLNKIVVMGKTTYDSLPKKPLPNRVNVVLWDKATSLNCLEDCITFNAFEPLLNFIKILSKEYDVFICGGASIYKLFLPYYDEVLVTKVEAEDKEATVFFPNLDENEDFELTNESSIQEESGLKFKFTKYKRL